MNTFRFRQFPVYKEAKLLHRNIILILSNINDRSLHDQIRRSSLSVVLSIAEGSAKRSDRDFARYLQISLGSINELVACLEIAYENSNISQETFKRLENNCEIIAKQLGGFVKKLLSSKS
ncbi:hypothetical protein CL634_04605 [bacterium]|nr:hypothetical protein [bacterium]